MSAAMPKFRPDVLFRGLVPLFCTALLLAGCSSSTSSSATPRGNRDLITRAQIEQMSVADAYEVVQRLRSDVLRSRGTASMSGSPNIAVVYVDGVRRGGPEVLRQIRANEVEQIAFIKGTDATTRWGTDHGGGVIEVRTRQGR